jgi:hypothetical protein
VVVAAARYLRVPPWELFHAPVEWIYYAAAASTAEAHAQEAQMKRK